MDPKLRPSFPDSVRHLEEIFARLKVEAMEHECVPLSGDNDKKSIPKGIRAARSHNSQLLFIRRRSRKGNINEQPSFTSTSRLFLPWQHFMFKKRNVWYHVCTVSTVLTQRFLSSLSKGHFNESGPQFDLTYKPHLDSKRKFGLRSTFLLWDTWSMQVRVSLLIWSSVQPPACLTILGSAGSNVFV